MDSEVESVKSNTSESEDDFGCYFLQPTSTPYNITEKVQQANVDLFTSSPYLSVKEKNGKVKFRDELISFEPDLTDDDVNSIESDNIDSECHMFAYKTTIVDSNNIYNIEEVEEKLVCEDIIEEITSEYNLGVQSIEHKSKPDQVENENIIEKSASGCGKRLHRRKCMKNNLFLNSNAVFCKDHCIEKLDFDMSISIKKLEIHDKVSLPPLQLIERKCCDEIKQKLTKNLPSYNGMRSEYGLTSRQLEKRQKQQEKLKQRELNRRKLMEDYRKRKIQQNEEVFCQWLKEVAHRKSENKETCKKMKSKQSINPKVLNLSGKSKDRPKTANQFIPKTNVKKKQRPHSTHSSIYIEVPQVLLEKGVNIGDIMITNAKLFSRKLHILAIP